MPVESEARDAGMRGLGGNIGEDTWMLKILVQQEGEEENEKEGFNRGGCRVPLLILT